MSLATLPSAASWRHEGLRAGFEVTFFAVDDHGVQVEGATTATENGEPWVVSYVIGLDLSWRTRTARITRRSRGVAATTLIQADGNGTWWVDGVEMPLLQGCLDLRSEERRVGKECRSRR